MAPDPSPPADVDAAIAAGAVGVVAYGSNASPVVLRRKLGERAAAAVLAPPVVLPDTDVVFSAHVSRHGAIPATIVPWPGTEVDAWLLARPARRDRRARRHRAQLRARAPRPRRPRAHRVRVAPRPLRVGGHPVALAGVPARGRTLRALTETEMLEQVRARARVERGAGSLRACADRRRGCACGARPAATLRSTRARWTWVYARSGVWARRTGIRTIRLGARYRRDLEEEAPRLEFTRRHVILFLVFVVATLAFLYFVLPQIAGTEGHVGAHRARGDPLVAVVALVFTIASFGGYVVMFQAVFVRAGSRIDLRASYQITMAGLAATRLFAAGGAGGIALTAWALRRSGMPRRKVADKTLAFLILQYVDLHGGARRLRLRPAYSASCRGPRRSASRSCRRSSAHRDRHRAGARRSCPPTCSAASRASRARRAAGAHRAAARQRAGRVLGRACARRSRTCAARPGAARRARLLGLQHRDRCGRASTRSATPPSSG